MRVSTSQQQHEGTIESQRRALQHHMQHHGWSLLPEHESIDDGISGARLDRPALDRLRDAARRGEFNAVVLVSPDRLARNDAHQWLLIEEFAKLHTPLSFLQHPFGDSPQGKLLTQMQGMMAEYERAQMAERTRRGRVEKARPGAFMPWAYTCYGYRSLPKRHGCAPQVMIDPVEAAVVRDLYRALVEERLSCRQITKRLNAAKTPTPTGKTRSGNTQRSAIFWPIAPILGRYGTTIDSPCSPRRVRRRSTDCSISRPAEASGGLPSRSAHPTAPGKTVDPLAWRDSGHGSQRGAFPYVGVPPREQPAQTGKRPSQPVCHRDNRCGPAGPGRMVILIPSWLHFIMPPTYVVAQRTFGMPWFSSRSCAGIGACCLTRTL